MSIGCISAEREGWAGEGYDACPWVAKHRHCSSRAIWPRVSWSAVVEMRLLRQDAQGAFVLIEDDNSCVQTSLQGEQRRRQGVHGRGCAAPGVSKCCLTHVHVQDDGERGLGAWGGRGNGKAR
jgi:hypothetical protein